MSTLPTTFAERVRERITEQIADLIPAEDLTRLIELRIAEFKQKELPKLIDDSIRAQLAEAIKAEFQKPEYQGTWSGYGGQGASQMTLELIEQHAPRILSSMIGGTVQMVLQTMHSQRLY